MTWELLLRSIDRAGTPEDHRRAVELLRTDGRAREFLREVAEQSVMIGDLERMAVGRQAELLRGAAPAPAEVDRTELGSRAHRWRRKVAAAAAVLILPAAFAVWLSLPHETWVARITKVTGSSQIFGFQGKIEKALEAGAILIAGDTLETRSCDAWIELELRDGSKMTIGQHSEVRILGGQADGMRFDLTRGSLWISPGRPPDAALLSVQTPTLVLEGRGAQFDVQTFMGETMARINQGSVRVLQLKDQLCRLQS